LARKTLAAVICVSLRHPENIKYQINVMEKLRTLKSKLLTALDVHQHQKVLHLKHLMRKVIEDQKEKERLVSFKQLPCE